MLLGLKESNRLPTKPHLFTLEVEDGEVNELERGGEIKEGKAKANGVSLGEGDDDEDEDLGLGFGLKLRLRVGY